ncbi:MAG: hypothetical protein ABSF90_29520, partial [Syntrophobacteraceae bacterium]
MDTKKNRAGPPPATCSAWVPAVQRKRGRAESAGINRHRVGDERAPHKRRSCSIMAPSHVRVAVRLHVMQ